MSLPIDARLPDAQLKRGRQALARAKVVGEEYTGVEVATATVRARARQARRSSRRPAAGASRRSCSAPRSRRAFAAALGSAGAAGPLENYVGDVTKYVVNKADCRVIVTAPPAAESAADDSERRGRDRISCGPCSC